MAIAVSYDAPRTDRGLLAPDRFRCHGTIFREALAVRAVAHLLVGVPAFGLRTR